MLLAPGGPSIGETLAYVFAALDAAGLSQIVIGIVILFAAVAALKAIAALKD